MKKMKKSRKKLRKKGQEPAAVDKKVLFVRVPVELAEKLREYCYRNGMRLNQAVVLAIKNLLGDDNGQG